MTRHRTVFGSQYNVCKEFERGSTDARTSNNNLRACGNLLIHYGTVAAVRTKKHGIINNLQDWASGFAKVTHPSATDALDLSTLESIRGIGRYGLESLEILDSADGYDLIKIGDRYFIDGVNSDSAQRTRFVAELVQPVQNVADALTSMKPNSVQRAELHGVTVPRQGELFFIPIASEALAPINPQNIERNHREPAIMYRGTCTLCGAKTKEYSDESAWQLRTHPQPYDTDLGNNTDTIRACPAYQQDKPENAITERATFKMSGEPVLYIDATDRNQRSGHHTATETATTTLNGQPVTIARGTVKHTVRGWRGLRHEHINLELGKDWHIVQRNVIKGAWAALPRGTGAD